MLETYGMQSFDQEVGQGFGFESDLDKRKEGNLEWLESIIEAVFPQ